MDGLDESSLSISTNAPKGLAVVAEPLVVAVAADVVVEVFCFWVARRLSVPDKLILGRTVPVILAFEPVLVPASSPMAPSAVFYFFGIGR